MPVVGIGTWLYNDSVVKQALPTAFRLGYRHVDTALGYENQVGVGEALREAAAELNLLREDYFVTSKIPGGLNATATVASLELSLRQLGLDYVDLMLIHFPATMDAQMAGGRARRQEEWKALQEWAKQGKARSVGVSHYCRRQFQDVLDVATVPVAVNQVQYHVGMGSAGRNATDDFDFFQSIGTVFESFSPLCGASPGGAIAGRRRRGLSSLSVGCVAVVVVAVLPPPASSSSSPTSSSVFPRVRRRRPRWRREAACCFKIC